MSTSRLRSIHDTRYKAVVTLVIDARLSAGISQSELAKAVGLKQPDISKIENNERRLDIIELLDILKFVSKKSNNPHLIRDILVKLLGEDL